MTRAQIKILDKLWRDKVRSRGMCLHCETTENLQAHHILSRTHRATRWDQENGVCLCYRCHLHWAHTDPIEFSAWATDMWGSKTINQLRNRSRDVALAKRLDFETLKAELEAPRKQRRS